MIPSTCKIYVKDRGFVPALDVAPGDMVMSLDGKRAEEIAVSSVSSEFQNVWLNYVDSGQHNVYATEDALFLYYSEDKGKRYLDFKQIPNLTPNKEVTSSAYLPVLSYLYKSGRRNLSDVDVEYLARTIATMRHSYDRDSFFRISRRCTGEDALAFIHLLEHWVSRSPGKGWFGRANVKARMHQIPDLELVQEVARLAAFSGYTSMFIDTGPYALNINYASMPAPGSRPKNEKYKKVHYRGEVVNINAMNRPLLGISNTKRCFYLPCSSTLN